MKTQIRKSCFETNSSSMHAIVITNKEPKEIYTGYACEFRVGEFGWEHRRYMDVMDKASYLWTVIVNGSLKKVNEGTFYTSNYDGKEYENYHLELDIENERYKKIKQAIIDALVSIGFKNDGWDIRFQEEFEKTSYGSLETGYVDHDPGIGFAEEIVFNKDRLIRFLFNPSSFIETWNDNDWELDPKIEEELEKKYWNEETQDYKDGYWEAEDWAYFRMPPEEDIEWKYLKSN